MPAQADVRHDGADVMTQDSNVGGDEIGRRAAGWDVSSTNQTDSAATQQTQAKTTASTVAPTQPRGWQPVSFRAPFTTPPRTEAQAESLPKLAAGAIRGGSTKNADLKAPGGRQQSPPSSNAVRPPADLVATAQVGQAVGVNAPANKFRPPSFVAPSFGAKRPAAAQATSSPPITKPSNAPADTGALAERGGDEAKAVYQVPYTPASKLPPTGALIASSLAAPLRKALASLETKRGPVDDFVARSIGISTDDLRATNILAAEQVDAAALGIDAVMEGREQIINDATGFGKGRAIMTIAAAGIRLGRNVILVTERPNLYSDIWRDIRKIGMTDLFGQPIIMNSDSKGRIVDMEDVDAKGRPKVIFKHEPQITAEIAAAMKWPEGRRFMLTCYSQINRTGIKADMFIALARDALLICDESHNVVQESNVGTNILAAKGVSAAAINASATHGRNVREMLAYGDVMPWLPVLSDFAGYDFNKFSFANRKALAEASAICAVGSGGMIGRQHDMSGMRMVIKDIAEQQPELASYEEKFAAAGRAIIQIWRATTSAASDIPGEWQPGNFGTAYSMINRGFSIACRLDAAAADAVALMNQGKKYVGVLSGTQDAAMSYFMDMAGSGGNLPLVSAQPDFADLIRMTGRRMARLSAKVGGETMEISVTTPEVRLAMAALETVLNGFPDLPISPLDYLRRKIESEAAKLNGGVCPPHMRVGEISGRMWGFDEDGKIVKFEPADRNETIYGFNNGGPGAIGALLTTRAGAVGLSIQDSPEFKSHGIRHMQEIDPIRNVLERIQMWGRIARRGQQTKPEYSMLCSSLPGDLYDMVSQVRKIAEVAAVATGNAESLRMIEGVCDPIDSAGEQAAAAFLADNPRVRQALMIAGGNDDVIDGDNQADTANEFSTILSLLRRIRLVGSVEAQTHVFNQLMRRRDETLMAYPPDIPVLDGIWRETGRFALDPARGNTDPLIAISIETARATPAINAARIAKMLETTRNQAAIPPEMAGIIDATRSTAMEAAATAAGYPSLMAAMADTKANKAKDINAAIPKLKELIANCRAGGVIRIKHDSGETRNAVVIKVRCRSKAECCNPRAYEVECVVPGDDQPRRLSFDPFVKHPEQYHLSHGVTFQQIARRFDLSVSKEHTIKRMVICGDPIDEVLASLSLGGGTRSSFKVAGPSGALWRHGILVPRHMEKEVEDMPVRVGSAQRAYEYMVASGAKLATNGMDIQSGMSMRIAKTPSNMALAIEWGQKMPRIAKRIAVQSAAKVLGIPIGDDDRLAPDGRLGVTSTTVFIRGDQWICLFLTAMINNGVPLFASASERNYILGLTEETKQKPATYDVGMDRVMERTTTPGVRFSAHHSTAPASNR